MQPPDIPRGAFKQYSFTFTADAARSLAEAVGATLDDVLTDGTIQALTNAAKYGDYAAQEGEIAAGGSLSFDYLPLAEMKMKNKTAGSNAKVVITGYTARRRVGV